MKTAIVTGDSSGIGRATAKALSDMGCTVYGFSRRGCDLPGIRHLSVDVTSEEGVRAAVEHVADREGRIDILVNCAGFGISGAVEFVERLPPAMRVSRKKFYLCVEKENLQ